MSTKLDEVREALFASGLVQPLDGSLKAGSFTLFCRAVQGTERGWMKLLENFLMAGSKAAVDVHVCKRYKLDSNNRIAYGWYINMTAKSAKEISVFLEDHIIPLIVDSKPEVPEKAKEPTKERPAGTNKLTVISSSPDSTVIEMPLPHVKGDRNIPNRKGKGATMLSVSSNTNRR